MPARGDASRMCKYQSPGRAAWREENLPPVAIIVSPVGDAALLSTGRKVIHIDAAVTLPVFDSFLRDGGIRYLFAPPRWLDECQSDFQMRESRRFWSEPVPGAPNLFRVHSRFRETPPAVGG